MRATKTPATELRWGWDQDDGEPTPWPEDYRNPLDYYPDLVRRHRFRGWWYGLADLLGFAALIWLLSR